MSISHRIDKKTKTVFVTAKGDIEIEGLIKKEMEIIEDPDFESGMNMFLDFSDARPAPSADYAKIKMSADFVKSIQPIQGKCKWSIYAPLDDAYHYSVIYSRLTDDLDIRTKVFRNKSEALKWLGI